MSTQSLSSLSHFTDSFGKIPSLITSFVTDESSESSQLVSNVQETWDCIQDNASPEKFVDSLIGNEIIAFRGLSSGSQAIRLFSRYIQPLLNKIAAAPCEREFLSQCVHHLRKKNWFICIIPRFGKTSDGENSYNIRAIQGVPFTQTLSNLGFSLENCPQTVLEDVLRKVDSFVIELFMGKTSTGIMVDNEQMWHLGNPSHRSTLLHELIHVDHRLTDELSTKLKIKSRLSWRWTHEEEERTVCEENRYLLARNKKQRLSHKTIAFTYLDSSITDNESFKRATSTQRLEYSLLLGADGLMKTLCSQHIAAPKNSADRVMCNPDTLTRYAESYLIDFPEDEHVKSEEIDRLFQMESRRKKNSALKHFVSTLLQDSPQGCEQVKFLLLRIVQLAPLKRYDVSTFIGELIELLPKA